MTVFRPHFFPFPAFYISSSVVINYRQELQRLEKIDNTLKDKPRKCAIVLSSLIWLAYWEKEEESEFEIQDSLKLGRGEKGRAEGKRKGKERENRNASKLSYSKL